MRGLFHETWQPSPYLEVVEQESTRLLRVLGISVQASLFWYVTTESMDEIRKKFDVLSKVLDERQLRLWTALEAEALG